MHPNWLGLLSCLLTLAVFAWVYGKARGWSWRRKCAGGLLTGVLALPGASFAIHYTHLLPELAWYYELRSIAGSELLVLPIGAAGACAAALLPRGVRILPLLATVLLTLAPVIKPFLLPLGDDSFKERWKEDVCLQSTASTCGPSSAATILRSFGQQASESELAVAAHSHGRGTEAWYLARALRARGLQARFEFAPGFAPEGGLPAVVGVRLGEAGHFIAVLGRQGDAYVIGDPLVGREVLSREQLEKRYIFTGLHLRVTGPVRGAGS